MPSNFKRLLDTTSQNEPQPSRASKVLRKHDEQAFPVPREQWEFKTPDRPRTKSLPTPQYKDGQLIDVDYVGTVAKPSSSTSDSESEQKAFRKELDAWMKELLKNEYSDSSSWNGFSFYVQVFRPNFPTFAIASRVAEWQYVHWHDERARLH